jgi:PAS domain S-box-containing protein
MVGASAHAAGRMKAPAVQSESLLGPSPAQFAALFPFHFVVDDANRVVQFGDTLAAVCPGLAIGSNLEDHLTIRRPVGATLTAGIGSHLASLFLLQLRTRDLQLRGQILPLPGGRVLFVGSPWITDLQNIQELGISLDSFALHDASMDLIHAVQAQRMAAADHQRLVERLKQQRSELQQANAQLKVREAEATKLSHVAARTHNAVVITDRDGRIEWVNQSFTRLTGYASGEVLGRTPGSVLQGPDSDQPTVAFMREKVWKAEGFKAELINYAKDGRRYWVEVEVQPVLDEMGEATNFIAIEQDVTERVEEQRRRDLQQAVSTIITENDSLEQGVFQLLKCLGSALEAGFGGCWPVDRTTLRDMPFTIWTDGVLGRDASADGAIEFVRERLFPVAHTDEPVYLHPPAAAAEALTESLLPVLALPCRADNRVVAKVILVGERIAPPSAELGRLLGILGNQIGQFIARNQARKELQRSRDFAMQVMNLMGQGLTVTDEIGYFSYVNDAFAQMVGRPKEDLIGRLPSEVSPADDRDTFTLVRKERAQGKSSSYQVKLQQPGGTMLPVLITGVPRMERGRLAGTIAVVTDLTEQKRVEHQMEAALARERELNSLKSSFVTMASHEFRTPLTGIVYAAEMLASHVKALPEGTGTRQQRYVEIIMDGSKRMSDLMNDLLLLGRIESGKMATAPAPVELAAFAEELWRQIGTGNERLEIRLDPTLPAVALLDTNILSHALLNLLGNGLKYSVAPAGVTLGIHLEPAGETQPARLCFSVRDHGCGIPPADQEKLFQPFFRATNVGKIRGTGIGLTIARDCTRLHGGELTFESRVGEGTTFFVRIPFQPAK